MQKICSPEFNIPVSGFNFKVTAENGMCSYGVGNVGTYNSTFTKRDVIDQVHDNPAGQFDYDELIGQAKEQTYVLTSLFSTTDIPEAVFSVFVPNEIIPTTIFQNLSQTKVKIKYFCYPTPPNYSITTQNVVSIKRSNADYACFPRR